MSAYALRACVLIYIDNNAGFWVSATDIVRRVGTTPERVANVCAQLVEAGMVHHGRIDGSDWYGTQVEGVPLPISAPVQP